MRVVLIDNYDSFTYNVYQQLGVVGKRFETEVCVYRNDQITLEQLKDLKASGLVLSPGPGGPEDAGISSEVITAFSKTTPILGICLGLQVIAHAFGAVVSRAHTAMHGKTSLVRHTGQGIFTGLASPLKVARYHSLAVEQQSLITELQVDATTDDGVIMALSHKDLPLWGLQFHPESFLSQGGDILIENFLEVCARA